LVQAAKNEALLENLLKEAEKQGRCKKSGYEVEGISSKDFEELT